MQSNYKRLGDYIQEVSIKNTDLKVNNLIGVSIDKKFIKSVANTIGVDMSTYKIIQKNQLACKLMSVGRDEKLPVDLYIDEEPSLVSSAYYVFEPKDNNILMPEYLKMWLFRSETDRFVGYVSGGDVRGGISWDTFCDIPIKVPAIEKQQEIVNEYHTIQNRINLNNQLIAKLEETAQTIYKQWFVDFEFPFDFAQGKPSENGKPYKSNGGKMVWCEELEKEIPEGWEVGKISDISNKIFSGGTPSTDIDENWNGKFYWLSSGETGKKYILNTERKITELGIKNSTTKKSKKLSTVIATAGQGKTRGQSALIINDVYINQSIISVEPLKIEYSFFIFLNINHRYEELRNDSDAQSIRGSINSNDIKNLSLLIPFENLIEKFYNTIKSNFEFIVIKTKENQKLEELKELLLGRMVRN